jgi:hypothetical protein
LSRLRTCVSPCALGSTRPSLPHAALRRRLSLRARINRASAALMWSLHASLPARSDQPAYDVLLASNDGVSPCALGSTATRARSARVRLRLSLRTRINPAILPHAALRRRLSLRASDQPASAALMWSLHASLPARSDQPAYDVLLASNDASLPARSDQPRRVLDRRRVRCVSPCALGSTRGCA